MVSIDDDKYWDDLKQKVTDYRDSYGFMTFISRRIFRWNLKKEPEINFFNERVENCKYQQKIAEGWLRYYPLRMSQFISVIAFFAGFILSYFRDNFIIIISSIIIILFLVILIIRYIEYRLTKLQVFIEKAERRIQYYSIQKNEKIK